MAQAPAPPTTEPPQNTIAKASIVAKARAAVRPAIWVAKAKTLARARAAAKSPKLAFY
jgi:hypothetical protein